MKKIPTTQGYYILVDDEDFSHLSRFSWFVHQQKMPSGRIYRRAVRELGRQMYGVETFLLPRKEGYFYIHKNGDGLDNRKENIVLAPRSILSQRYGKKPQKRGKKPTSKYVGVCLRKDWKNKWQARISKDGKRIALGFFDTEEDAAIAYNESAKELYGVLAYQNEV